MVVFLCGERIRGEISLARYRSQLIAKGEKLSIPDLATNVPADQNGAPRVLELQKKLQSGQVLPDNYPPHMEVLPSGRAVVCFRERDWNVGRITNNWQQLASDLRSNETVLVEIRRALSQPVLRVEMDHSLGFRMLIPELAPAKSLIYWFDSEAELALHNGAPHEALQPLLAHLELPRMMAEDHLAISELVRIAIASFSKGATWEALQAEGWNDEDLAQLQKGWQNLEFIAPLTLSTDGERAFSRHSHDLLRKSNDEACNMLFFYRSFTSSSEWHPNFFQKQIYCRVWRFAWSHQDEWRDLELQQGLVEIEREASRTKSFAAVVPLLFKLDEAFFLKRTWYDNIRFPQGIPALSGMVKRAMRAETDRSLAIAAIALKRFELRHGKKPASLGTLVPEFLDSVPIDYMDGTPLKYRLKPDGNCILYSVGEDGKDDGGSTETSKPGSTALSDRKDYVWPEPASAQEAAEWRARSLGY
jgi:hypothetical protein